MSDTPPPAVAQDAAVGGAQALTPERIEAVLADFRAWLQEAARQDAAAETPPPGEPLDLHTLLAQFTALRHEVNLQTRAVRAQQEQNAETLRQLSEALEALRRATPSGPPADPQADGEQQRTWLKTLVDLHDALSLAGREVGRMQDAIGASLDGLLRDSSAASPPAARRPFWARWLGGRSEQPTPAAPPPQTREAADRLRQLLDSLLTGYAMSLQRLERALHQHGLEPIRTAGELFDPERMEVVGVVTGGAHPAGTVVQEVRRGYLCRGRVFRYAQVSVAKL